MWHLKLIKCISALKVMCTPKIINSAQAVWISKSNQTKPKH